MTNVETDKELLGLAEEYGRLLLIPLLPESDYEIEQQAMDSTSLAMKLAGYSRDYLMKISS